MRLVTTIGLMTFGLAVMSGSKQALGDGPTVARLLSLQPEKPLARAPSATDSTRLITLMIRLGGFGAHIPGVSGESHNLSHHVGREDKLDQLNNLELAEFRELAALLAKLKATKEGDATLLDRTQDFYGSNLGNGNNHDTHNLPMLFAGGGYKHGQHLAFDKTNNYNYPLPNLFVAMLQRLGIEADKFATGTGTMTGLELA